MKIQDPNMDFADFNNIAVDKWHSRFVRLYELIESTELSAWGGLHLEVVCISEFLDFNGDGSQRAAL